KGIPRPVLGDPGASRSLARFQDAFRAAWDDEVGVAERELRRFFESASADGCGVGLPATAPRGAPHWTFERAAGGDGPKCGMTFKYGWPEVHLAYTVPEAGKLRQSCDVEVPDELLASFRLPRRRPYANARIRLVSEAMGSAAEDVGELI